MKKVLLIIFAVSLHFTASTQTILTSNYQDRWQYYFNLYNSYTPGVANLYKEGSWKRDKNVKSLKQTVFQYKKGKRLDVATTSIDMSFINGQMTDYKYYKKGQIHQEYQYKYNDNGFFTNYKDFKKGDLIAEENREYNDSNKVLKFESFRKDKKESSYVVQYMGYTKVLRQDNYRKDNTEPIYTWIYDYYEDGKKKMSEYYKNGKLKRRYLYTCDDEGKEVKDTVKTSKVCYLTEYNADSSYVKIYRNTDSKGKIRKQRYTYNKNDKLLSYENINAKGETTFSYFYEYDKNDNKLSYKYYRNSKLRVNEEFKYNTNNKIIETIWYNKKSEISSRNVYKRNENDKIIENIKYNSKGQITSKIQYQYDERGNKTKKIVYKKDEIKTEYNYIYEYI